MAILRNVWILLSLLATATVRFSAGDAAIEFYSAVNVTKVVLVRCIYMHVDFLLLLYACMLSSHIKLKQTSFVICTSLFDCMHVICSHYRRN